MANISDKQRNHFMLRGPLSKRGYDWWWHSFTAEDAETGEEKPFFIEYFTCNPNLAEDEPVFGQHPHRKKDGKKPSYLMVKAGWWGEDATQLHRFYAWKDVTLPYDTNLNLTAPECSLTESHMTGTVTVSKEDAAAHPEYMSDSGSMSWDLDIDKKVAFNVGYGASKFFQRLNAFEMFWHAEGMKTEYSGTIICNGRKFVVRPETSYGYADKNWGGDFTSPWVWLSSNNLTSLLTGKKLKNSVFDIGGGRPKVLGVALNRKLLSDFWYEGKSYEFNFSKFWTFCRTKFECSETDTAVLWHVRQETTSAIMDTKITCQKKDMLFVNYEAPNGKKLHNRLFNGGNGIGVIELYSKKGGKTELIDRVEAKNIGCEFGEYGELGE
ncbi:Tocopherol cyclase [Butyrivibrio sp. YAB3001]|nr:Tocopherol cyclase [Butyrivibrio sp. YAB3001]